jgi:isopenicillin N synthase-like dioxygenase
MAPGILTDVPSVKPAEKPKIIQSDANAAPPFQIPTVDISAFLAEPNSPAAQAIVPTVRAACRSTGFFQIVGHGISRELQQAVFAGAKKFFALPFATKKALDCKSVPGLRGYDVLASQSYEDGILPDLKEGYYVGIDLPAHDPRVQAGRILMGSNVWPDPSWLSEEEFRQPAERYHADLLELTVQLLRLVERTLPYGPGVFDDFITSDPITPMRMLHYPPAAPTEADEEQKQKQYGASAHTDFGAITLLLQDQSPGLEVLDRNTGAWVSVPPNPDAYVVNVGDMLSFWTKGEYVSSIHRVNNRNPSDRYSIVFFFDGNIDAKLSAMDGSEEDVSNPLTVEQHMTRRVADSYGKNGSSAAA